MTNSDNTIFYIFSAETSTVEKQQKKSSFKIASFCDRHDNLLTFINSKRCMNTFNLNILTSFPPITLQSGNVL